jgi:hypothetical protein
MAIVRAISPLLRPRVVFWLFLALLLTLAALVQLGHTVTTSAVVSDVGYTLVSADGQAGGDCIPHSGAMAGSHCCSVSGSGCVAAIVVTPAAASPFDALKVQATANDAAAPRRATSPFFHPPKLIVQA